MAKYTRWDAANGILHVDVSGVVVDKIEIVDEIIDEALALARTKSKPWLIVCWKDLALQHADVAEHYGRRLGEVMRYVAGVVRYAANDPATRMFMRAQTLKHRNEGTKARLYETFEDALTAVRELRAKES